MKLHPVRRLTLALSPFALLAVTAAPPLQAQENAGQTQSVNPQSDAAKAWKIADSDVPADAAVLYGVLPNGMKYAVMKNATPKGRVAIRMQFNIGSLAEEDDQRGLAHFLEHMAFNGSKNVPEGEMIKLLERKGLAFGADTNASTGFDATEYKLDLPQPTEDLIDTGLMLMRETASELTISEEAVQRERGVILSERRARDTYALRNVVGQFGFFYEGLSLVDRMPIGTEDVIRNAPAERLRDFYHHYYRPERTTLVIVGDIEPADMEAKIKRRFADWQGHGAAKPDPDLGAMAFDRPTAADIFVDPAITDTVNITYLKPYREEGDSIAKRSRSMLENIGKAIIGRRFAKIAADEQAPIMGGGLSDGDGWKIFNQISVTANAKEGGWAEALAVAEQELRRLREFGVTEAEVQEQLANFRNALTNAATNAGTRRSESLANSLISASKNEYVFVTPEQSLKHFEAMEPSITAKAVSEAIHALFEGIGEPLIRITAKQDIAGGAEAVLVEYRKSQAQSVAAPADQAALTFAYDKIGKTGKIVSDERIADLGIRRLRFANGVMLNIKQTDFQKDRVSLSMRLDGGSLMATREDPTRVSLAASLAIGGMKAHSFDELRTIFAGRSISPAFGMSADSFGGSATTTPRDLPLQAKVMAAYLLHPGYRADGLAMMRRAFPQRYAAMDATPSAVLGRDQDTIITGDDPRMATPSLETMMALDWQALAPVIADNLRHGAIEIGIVGDVDEAAAIKAIAESFGALPKRRKVFDPRKAARDIRFTDDFMPRQLIHKGPAEQAELRIHWPARDDSDLAEAMQLNLLARVMSLKLLEEIREKRGGSYSPSAGVALSSTYPEFGRISAASNVDVAELDATKQVMLDIAKELRDQPVDDDLLDRARKPLLENMAKSRRENSYWLGYVRIASSKPDRLDRMRLAEGEISKATPADLQRLAQRYLRDDKALVIEAVSDKSERAKAKAR